MSHSLPAPRPALVRDPDGTVRSAAAHLSSLAVDEAGLAKSVKKTKKTLGRRPTAHGGKQPHGKDKIADDAVDLVVSLSKRDRKRLRRKAEIYGWTAEEAAAHVIRAWSGA